MSAVRSTVLALALTLGMAGTTLAQDVDLERPQMGVGFQSSWPAYGLSGIYDLNETVSGQAVVGFLGGWTTLSARGLYRVSQRPQVYPYGYGMVGMWRWAPAFGSSLNSVSFGGGAGVDIDLRILAEDLPPLFWNFELGLNFLQRALSTYDGVFMSFGAGIHYRF